MVTLQQEIYFQWTFRAFHGTGSRQYQALRLPVNTSLGNRRLIGKRCQWPDGSEVRGTVGSLSYVKTSSGWFMPFTGVTCLGPTPCLRGLPRITPDQNSALLI